MKNGDRPMEPARYQLPSAQVWGSFSFSLAQLAFCVRITVTRSGFG